MKIISLIADLRAELSGNTNIGFVPTMGCLHQGHLSLVRRAKLENQIVVMSIFVNPLQFGANEDFTRYPRPLEKDREMAFQSGVDLLFLPSIDEMYPNPLRTYIDVNVLTEPMCGRSRPGHFKGVATVVSKLFNCVQPQRAYFGEKDAQQLAIIKQMVDDLSYPVQICACPTLREPDGLAMSSRNHYLTPQEREQAPVLFETLTWCHERLRNGVTNLQALQQEMQERIQQHRLAKVEYIEILNYPSLNQIEMIGESAIIIALAVRFGQTRLIDNIILSAKDLLET